MKIYYSFYEKFRSKYEKLNIEHDKTDKEIKKFKKDIKILDEKISKQKSIENLKYHKPFDFDKGFVKKFFSMFSKGGKYLITMHCSNKETSHFIVETQEKYFIFENGVYVIVAGHGKKNRQTGVIEITYEQGLAIPVELDIDSESVKDKLSIANTDVIMSIDPVILKRYTDGNFVEKVLTGDKLESDISLLRLLTICSICVNLGVLLLVLSQVL